VGTGAINIFTLDSRPAIETRISTPVITPNGDGANDVAAIDFVLAQFAGDLEVDAGVYDLSGRQVRRLISGFRTAGAYAEQWDGMGNTGEVVPPGIYLIRFSVKADAQAIETAKLIGVAY
jgi:flagellar hook assembly protein FlgD